MLSQSHLIRGTQGILVILVIPLFLQLSFFCYKVVKFNFCCCIENVIRISELIKDLQAVESNEQNVDNVKKKKKLVISIFYFNNKQKHFKLGNPKGNRDNQRIK